VIVIRPYLESDLPRVKALHRAQGFDYELPNMRTVPIAAIVEENNKITHAFFLRNLAEAYWIFDPKGESRKSRLGKIFMLRKVITPIAKETGFDEVVAFLPPELTANKCTEKTMLHIGWERMEWQPYRYKL
jgi:hypothetical protein